MSPEKREKYEEKQALKAKKEEELWNKEREKGEIYYQKIQKELNR